MSTHSIEELLQLLLHSSNDVWRDEAAEELAKFPDSTQAEQALFLAISSPLLDDSLRRTCAESLANIWIRSGGVERQTLETLAGMPRTVAEAFLKAAKVQPFA